MKIWEQSGTRIQGSPGGRVLWNLPSLRVQSLRICKLRVDMGVSENRGP